MIGRLLAFALCMFATGSVAQVHQIPNWPPATVITGGNLTVLDGTGHGNDAGGTSVSASLTTTQGSGVVVACVTQNSIVPPTVTSGSLTYTLQYSDGTGGTDWIFLFTSPYSSNISESITATKGLPAVFTTLDVFGVGKAATTSFLDGSGAAGNPDPISISGSNANDFVVGCARVGTASPTAGACCTIISGADFQLAEYVKTTVAPSSLAVNIGTGVGTANGMVAAAIKSQ